MADSPRRLARVATVAAIAAVAATAVFVAPAVAAPAATHMPARKKSRPHDDRPYYRPPPGEQEVEAVINGNVATVKTCYQSALLHDKTLADGRVGMKLILGISGRVKHVAVEGAPRFRQLEPCLRDIVQRWVLPQASEEYGAELLLVFRAGELVAEEVHGGSGPETCSMTVKSVPSSALWIDGRDTGMKTPATIHKLSCSNHRLELRRPDGRIGYRELITLRPGVPLKLSRKLASKGQVKTAGRR